VSGVLRRFSSLFLRRPERQAGGGGEAGGARRIAVADLGKILRREGPGGLRRALAGLPNQPGKPLQPRAVASLAQVAQELPPTAEGAEAAAELIAWLAGRGWGAIGPGSLLRILRAPALQLALPAIEARLDSGEEAEPVTLLVLGLLRLGRGERAVARPLLERALAGDLVPKLRPLARGELAALRFLHLGPTRRPGGKALALVEPAAEPAVLEAALEKASPLLVCGTHLLVLQNEPGLRAALAEGRLVSIPYRIFQGQATFDAAHLFSERLIRLAAERLPRLAFLQTAGEEERAGFLTALRVRFRSLMAFTDNAMEAVRSSDAQRLFLVANGGWFAAPLAERLVAEGERELLLASGSGKEVVRRRLGTLLDLAEPLPALEGFALGAGGPERKAPLESAPDGGLPDGGQPDGGQPDGERLVGPPLIDLNQPAGEPSGKRRCLICVTFRIDAGMSIPLPLRRIVTRLLPDWEPLLLVLANSRSDPAILLERLRAELGDLLPSLPIKTLSIASAFGAAAMPEDTSRAVDALLSDASVAEVAIEGLSLARLNRSQVRRFFDELTQTAIMAPALQALLRDWAPEVLLMPQHPALEWKFLQSEARRLGLPTLGLQLFALNRDRWRPTLDVDHFLCIDDYSRDTVGETAAFPPERCSVIGAARWDELIARARGFDREEERAALALGAEEKLVLLATQPLDMEENHALIALTIEALSTVPQARLVVKLHPAENDGRLAAFARQAAASPLAERTLVTREHDTYRLLAATDLVINVFSNVGIEAAILGLNVVAVEIGVDTEMFSLGTLGIVEPARSRETAIAQIRGLLTDEDRRATARRLREAYFERNPQLRDGRSLDRLVAILERAADAGRAGTWAGRYAPPRAEVESLP